MSQKRFEFVATAVPSALNFCHAKVSLRRKVKAALRPKGSFDFVHPALGAWIVLPAAAAGPARVGDHHAGAVALGAGFLYGEKALLHAHLALAFASGADGGLRAGLGADAVAMPTVLPVPP